MITPLLQTSIDSLPANDDWGVDAARLLIMAVQQHGCSDLHLISLRDRVVARGRRDGTFVPLATIPPQRRELLFARFKVLARLPAFVRHEPQDGRIEWSAAPGAPPVILRASFLPTIHGENMVLRFPEGTSQILGLETLGMPAPLLSTVRRTLSAREGTFLLTGPSGSGKTTTLYAMMQDLHDRRGDRLNFLTIEDPVERDLGFAGQSQVNEAQGMTFDKALRAGLRQDPNVLLIGEIRDPETARIAIQAGMTGHLVLSTLHAGRASRVPLRLLSMGVEPYLVGSALAGALAQRLVRLACPHCTAAGCEQCNFSGTSGRTALFELVEMTEPIRQLILARAAPAEMALEIGKAQSGDLLREGRRLLDEGRITRAEYEFALGQEESPT